MGSLGARHVRCSNLVRVTVRVGGITVRVRVRARVTVTVRVSARCSNPTHVAGAGSSDVENMQCCGGVCSKVKGVQRRYTW